MPTPHGEVPLHRPKRLHRVPEPVYARMLEAAHRFVPGLTHEDAEELADAMLGPLRLLPPPPERLPTTQCPWVYFTETGEWLSCTGTDDVHIAPGRHEDENNDEWTGWHANDPRAVQLDR